MLLARSKTLQTGTAKYPITRVELLTITLVSGKRNKTLGNVFLGQESKRVIVYFVTNAAYNGDLKNNTYNFQHFKINFFYLCVDGDKGLSQPIQPHYENAKCKYVMTYHCLFSGTGIHFSDADNLITGDDYVDDYCLMAFDLAPVLSKSDITD